MYDMVQQEAVFVIKMKYPGNGQRCWDNNTCPFPCSQLYAIPNTQYATAPTQCAATEERLAMG